MDKYSGKEIHDMAWENKDWLAKKWCACSDMADLAKRVLPFINQGPKNRMANDYPKYKQVVAELEQIVKENE